MRTSMLARLTLMAVALLISGLVILGAAIPIPKTVPAFPAIAPAPAVATDPAVVDVKQQSDGSWQYLVNGTPEWPIGIGYNPVYRYLSDEERLANYHRDFRMFRDNGISLLVMWTAEKGAIQDPVDAILMDTANEYGLGAIVPFYFPVKENMDNPIVRQQMRDQVIGTVAKWKDHPATRMWGLGNEVLLEAPVTQHRAWASLFIQMADLVHELDPTHPVIYRESEDLFIAQLISLFGRRGIDRPWLHYGMNIYTMRIEGILDGWPSSGFNKPLFINEFGPPFDEDYRNRAQNYLTMWNVIRAHKRIVFGAAPYTWMAPGPDPYDGFYGLVGAQTATPVDNAWGVLTDAFRRARLED